MHFGYAAVAHEGHPDNVVGAYDAPAFLCPHGGGTATLVSFAFDNLVSLLALALGSGTFSDHLIKTSIYGTCSRRVKYNGLRESSFVLRIGVPIGFC